MSQKKEFQRAMAKFGLTDSATEILWELYYSQKKRLSS
jgi:hypothetical protein